MKNFKLLLLVAVISIVAGFVLLSGKKSDSMEPLAEEAQESTTSAPEIAPPQPQEPQNKVAPLAVESSQEVAAAIEENLAGARKVFQQKAAIEKASPEENHHTPKVTLDAARRLGEIAELEAQHPEQAASFRDFYLECARDDSTMTVTRAQCLDRYLKASRMGVAERKQFLADFPNEIARLVEALQ